MALITIASVQAENLSRVDVCQSLEDSLYSAAVDGAGEESVSEFCSLYGGSDCLKAQALKCEVE
jgi:hypothetical protein